MGVMVHPLFCLYTERWQRETPSGCCSPRGVRNGPGLGAVCVLFRVPRRKPCAVQLLLEMRRSAGSCSTGPAVPTAVAGHRGRPEAAGTATPLMAAMEGRPGQVRKVG